MPNVLLQMLLHRANAVGYTAYPDNLVERFIEQSAQTGIDIFRISNSLNWIENMRVSITAVRKHTTRLPKHVFVIRAMCLIQTKKNTPYNIT